MEVLVAHHLDLVIRWRAQPDLYQLITREQYRNEIDLEASGSAEWVLWTGDRLAFQAFGRIGADPNLTTSAPVGVLGELADPATMNIVVEVDGHFLPVLVCGGIWLCEWIAPPGRALVSGIEAEPRLLDFHRQVGYLA